MKEKFHFSVDEQYGEWCTLGPWFNDTIFQNLHDPLYEEFFITASEYIYDLS